MKVVFAITATLSLLATATNAATVTYDIGTTTATYQGASDTLTGTFTVDFTANTLTAFNITVTGTATPGGTSPLLFSTPSSLSSTSVTGQNLGGNPTGMLLTLLFQNALSSNLSDAITAANFAQNSINFHLNSLTASGTATPRTSATPLPGALPLFATGIGALGLLGWRRKRKGICSG